MAISRHFRVNVPDVINEVIEGEAIILHLGTGRYYSARGCGAEVWAWASSGASTTDIVTWLEASYDADLGDISRAVDQFISDLLAEGLLIESSDESPVLVPPSVAPPKQAFEPPSVESFTDLQDLLLLDPVHEVDTALGWPYVTTTTGDA